MDNYDSNYPIEYYEVGTKYIFYRNVLKNTCFRKATSREMEFLPLFKKETQEQGKAILPNTFSDLTTNTKRDEFNKEVGIVVSKNTVKSDAGKVMYEYIDVLFDDGNVVGYGVNGLSDATLNQTDYAVKQPKLVVPAGLVGNKPVLEGNTETVVAKKGITEAGTEDQKTGITEANTSKKIGITEA